MKQFSLVRPKKLSRMVGQEKLAHQIRKLVKKTKPKAWGFFGASGYGKTTIARIIALSMQCKHRPFGEPCSRCWRAYSSKPIFELDAGVNTGAAELREFISGAQFVNIFGKGSRKVYLLDEVHNLSKHAQNALLKHMEDDSNSTVWIICSSEPSALIPAIRRRLISYTLKPLDVDGITAYTQRLLGPDVENADLVEALIEKGIDSPGLVAQAAMKFVGGSTIAESVATEVDAVDGLTLAIAVTKGDWESVCTYLQQARRTDARSLRASIVGLLRKQMIETTEFNRRNKALSEAVKRLSYMSFSDDLVIMAALAAELYTVTELFSEYKR